MIKIYVGGLGSGKTLSMVKDIFEGYMENKYQLLTNFNLKIKHKLLTKDMIKNYREWKYDNLMIGIDEVHILVDSRESMRKKNRIYSYWFTQTRKRNVELRATTQFLHQVEKRLRDVADYIIKCQCVNYPAKKKFKKYNFYGTGKEVNDHYVILTPYDRSSGKTLKKQIFYGNPYFNLYDTYEVIDPENYAEETDQVRYDYAKLLRMEKKELIKIIGKAYEVKK